MYIYDFHIRFAVLQDRFDFFFFFFTARGRKVFEERDTSVLLKSMLQRFPIMQLFGSFGKDFFMTAVLIKICDLT